MIEKKKLLIWTYQTLGDISALKCSKTVRLSLKFIENPPTYKLEKQKSKPERENSKLV